MLVRVQPTNPMLVVLNMAEREQHSDELGLERYRWLPCMLANDHNEQQKEKTRK